MISDDTKGNITTIITWLITIIGSGFGITELTQNDTAAIIGAIIVAVINYYNMKYNNTFVEPVNAELTETAGDEDDRAA